jgi:hypothetical protein
MLAHTEEEPGHLTPDGADQSQEELVADIERTREQLGETVDALAGKLDFKQQTLDRVEATWYQLNQKLTRLQALSRRHATALPVVALTVVVASLGLIVWKRRR